MLPGAGFLGPSSSRGCPAPRLSPGFSLSHLHPHLSCCFCSPAGDRDAQSSCPRPFCADVSPPSPPAHHGSEGQGPIVQALAVGRALRSQVRGQSMQSTPFLYPLGPHRFQPADPTDAKFTHLDPSAASPAIGVHPVAAWLRVHMPPAGSALSQRHQLPHASSGQLCCVFQVEPWRPPWA